VVSVAAWRYLKLTESIRTLQIADVHRAGRTPVEHESDRAQFRWIDATLHQSFHRQSQRFNAIFEIERRRIGI
jgi:hypothetical protein